MARLDTSNAKRCPAWMIGLVFASGCAHSQTDIQNRVARRAVPIEIGVDQSKSRADGTAGDRATKDSMVRTAAATQPEQATATQRANERAVPVPPVPAIPPSSEVAVPSASTAATLPSDSDDAALDADRRQRPDRCRFPMRSSWRSAFNHDCVPQLEIIAEARGLQQIAFSTFLPSGRAPITTWVSISLGVGGQPIQLGKGLPGFSFIPGVGAVPFGLNIGTSFELAELKVQWLLLDFGRRLGRYEQARLANDVAAAPDRSRITRRWPTKSRSHTTTFSRSQALRRTAQDALRRSEEELADARKRQREGVIEREIVLRSEVQHAETLQLLHTATEAEFVALAQLNLAIGLKVQSAGPSRRARRRAPPLATSLARLPGDGHPGASRVSRRSAHGGNRRRRDARRPGRVRSQGHREWNLDSTSSSNSLTVTSICAWGSSGSTGRSSRVAGRSPRLAWRTHECGRRWRRSSRLPIRSHSRSTKRIGMPSRPGLASTTRDQPSIRRARTTGSCNFGSARVPPHPPKSLTLRPRSPARAKSAECTLQLPDCDRPPSIRHGSRRDAGDLAAAHH